METHRKHNLKNSKNKDFTIVVYYIYFHVESSLRQTYDWNRHRFVLVLPSFWKYTIQPLKKHPDLGQCTTQSSPVGPLHPLNSTDLLLDI